MLGDCVK
jgi:replication factor C subunit 2/4